jgi:AhpC/TSA family
MRHVVGEYGRAGGGTMTLQDKLNAYKEDFQRKVPPEKQAIMHRATEDLRHSGILDRVVKAGDPAPEFVLPNLRGEKISSSELLRRGPLVVTFYRGVW